jgi:hypothetical protein
MHQGQAGLGGGKTNRLDQGRAGVMAAVEGNRQMLVQCFSFAGEGVRILAAV